MRLLIFTTLLAGAFSAPRMQQSLSVNDDGSYQFFYETGKEAGSHSRSEVRHPDGVVIGKFSYEDPNGDMREVSYRADDSGYVANGDVGVDGAPKSQFPAEPEEANSPPDAPPAQETAPQAEESAPQEVAESHHDDDHKEEDNKKDENDEHKDLPLEESSANDPPEAFPPGFFLQHFQGLRRLPEPTTEEASTTAEVPSQETTVEPSSKPVEDGQSDEQLTASAFPTEDAANYLVPKIPNEMFTHPRHFQSFAPQPVGSSMFHQPVYVFSYQHPNAYGYHYYF